MSGDCGDLIEDIELGSQSIQQDLQTCYLQHLGEVDT